MTSSKLVQWNARDAIEIPTGQLQPTEIGKYAVQLAPREAEQVGLTLAAGAYEMATNFVWQKAIAALQRRLASLGMSFVGEMLGRPDVNEYSSIEHVVTTAELIRLSEDLGLLTSTDALRLRQTAELIAHFSRLRPEEAQTNGMRADEAESCLRTTIGAILGHDSIEVPRPFVEFRDSLEKRTYTVDAPELETLRGSPPFVIRTTISILLARLESSEGAAAEHARRNTEAIVPAVWDLLPEQLRWQLGYAYAKLTTDGNRKRKEATALGRALAAVQGFDYVPETLRSESYARAAKAILDTHGETDNFYHEGSAVQKLMELGTSIPTPAFPFVMSALTAVFMGNSYGHSWEGAATAEQVLDRLARDQWEYYVNSCVAHDKMLLAKLASDDKPVRRWFEFVEKYGLSGHLKSTVPEPLRLLVKRAKAKDFAVVKNVAGVLYRSA